MRRALAALIVFAALGLPVAAKCAEAPADPWPRQFKSGNATILVYQPQVESWTGNAITFRAAIAITKGDPKDDTFGVIWAKARTQVDKVSRIVLLEDVAVTRRDFPTLPDNGLLYLFSLRTQLGPSQRTVSLDRLEASLAASGSAAPHAIAVNNDPPRILVSKTPAILVPIDGPPALRPLPGTNFQRVINTRALLLADAGASNFYLRLGEEWLGAASPAGPWSRSTALPDGLEAAAKPIAAAGIVDLLAANAASASPSLESPPPTIHVSETPAALTVFEGEPAFTPVAGTGLARASNTTAEVFLETESNQYFILLAGRWFRAGALSGPWAFVPSPDLPADFRRIPPTSPAGAVLAAVAGTPQAEEALIAIAIPQTVTVKRAGGPTFAPRFDGAPQLAPVAGTSLQYVVNSPTPIIQVNPADFYAVQAGLWFSAPALPGPWIVAPSVPAAIYTIPPSSPLHAVTYVQIYGGNIGLLYEGYTPEYLGAVATPDGVVVQGTGFAYPAWTGSVWYPAPATHATDAPRKDVYAFYGAAVVSTARTSFSTVPGAPAGDATERLIIYTNPKTGKSSPYGFVKAANDVYADKNGLIYSNASGQWQQRSPAGWSTPSGDVAWAERESLARRAGEDRFNAFSQAVGQAENGATAGSGPARSRAPRHGADREDVGPPARPAHLVGHELLRHAEDRIDAGDLPPRLPRPRPCPLRPRDEGDPPARARCLLSHGPPALAGHTARRDGRPRDHLRPDPGADAAGRTSSGAPDPGADADHRARADPRPDDRAARQLGVERPAHRRRVLARHHLHELRPLRAPELHGHGGALRLRDLGVVRNLLDPGDGSTLRRGPSTIARYARLSRTWASRHPNLARGLQRKA